MCDRRFSKRRSHPRPLAPGGRFQGPEILKKIESQRRHIDTDKPVQTHTPGMESGESDITFVIRLCLLMVPFSWHYFSGWGHPSSHDRCGGPPSLHDRHMDVGGSPLWLTAPQGAHVGASIIPEGRGQGWGEGAPCRTQRTFWMSSPRAARSVQTGAGRPADPPALEGGVLGRPNNTAPIHSGDEKGAGGWKGRDQEMRANIVKHRNSALDHRRRCCDRGPGAVGRVSGQHAAGVLVEGAQTPHPILLLHVCEGQKATPHGRNGIAGGSRRACPRASQHKDANQYFAVLNCPLGGESPNIAHRKQARNFAEIPSWISGNGKPRGVEECTPSGCLRVVRYTDHTLPPTRCPSVGGSRRCGSCLPPSLPLPCCGQRSRGPSDCPEEEEGGAKRGGYPHPPHNHTRAGPTYRG